MAARGMQAVERFAGLAEKTPADRTRGPQHAARRGCRRSRRCGPGSRHSCQGPVVGWQRRDRAATESWPLGVGDERRYRPRRELSRRMRQGSLRSKAASRGNSFSVLLASAAQAASRELLVHGPGKRSRASRRWLSMFSLTNRTTKITGINGSSARSKNQGAQLPGLDLVGAADTHQTAYGGPCQDSRTKIQELGCELWVKGQRAGMAGSSKRTPSPSEAGSSRFCVGWPGMGMKRADPGPCKVSSAP